MHPAPSVAVTGAAPWMDDILPLPPLQPDADDLSQLLALSAHGLAAQPGPVRDALVAVLNGLLGEHLQQAEHPLATPLQLRHQGQVLAPASTPQLADALGEQARQRVLLLVHDLCLDEHSWQRDGHDYGALLAGTLDATVLTLRYNSGLAVHANAALLAEQLDRLHAAWPLTLQTLDAVGHGMGGLVLRSACAQAEAARQPWRGALRRLVFLGTPHLGLPVQRLHPWLRRVLGLRQVSAPLARLAKWRSAGMADLHQARLLPGVGMRPSPPLPLPLPAGVVCHALAGLLPGGSIRQRGDGLVPLDSALGRHADAQRSLGLPASQCWVADDVHHLELLSHARVYRRLLYALSD